MFPANGSQPNNLVRSVLKRERKSLLKSSVENIEAAQFMCCLASLDNDTGFIAYHDDIDRLF